MTPFFGALMLFQQGAFTGATSPSHGDTTGYWQQRVSYTMLAHLEEGLLGISARGQMRYVNNSPDTLREMYFHQYLNAFRPGSKWSASDERENRLRFQDLREPLYGYERFTSVPTVDGIAALVDYPGSPDSTVVHIRLPGPLAPGDSITVSFNWEARPSVVFRRQGRQGRTYDFAQWYPKVAVYDRGGWEPNALVPAGELYGEFATYDVTIVLRDDQILGATGVVVSGDPGWARVSKTDAPWMPVGAYRSVPIGPVIVTPPGERAVRFYAENVHHFAWTASPEYIYEGATYIPRDSTKRHFQTFDTVGVNVLYKPRDDTTWGGGRALKRTLDALGWLEGLYGPYAYPQITNVHRLDGGGTEFPMMIMDGSASYGLIAHELGHVYTYGILANNEWRSAWLDEGLTEYQSRWAQKLTPQDNRLLPPHEPPKIAPGYRANATTMAKADTVDFPELRVEMRGRSEPIGRSAADFREFAVYNDMVYDRAAIMYGHLRDLMGDSVFVAFLHDYYDRWALKHVDERAMRASAERMYGATLGWFFDQWLRGTGLLNYGIGADTTVRSDGKFITRVRVTRVGELRHAMPVGVHTADGWTIGRAKPDLDDQWVDIVTTAKPDSIAIDPFHVTWDWDWRDNTQQPWVGTIHAPDVIVDWPFLDQSNRSRTIVALRPSLWYSGPQGLIAGIGVRTNYAGLTDIHEAVVAVASRSGKGAGGTTTSVPSLVHFRVQADDVYLAPFMDRPLMGGRAGIAYLDGIARADLSKRWDLSPFAFANGPKIDASAGFTATYPVETLLVPEQWSNARVTEIMGHAGYRAPLAPDSQTTVMSLDIGVGYAVARDGTASSGGYGRVLGSLENVSYLTPGERTLTIRLNAGVAPNAPLQRSIFASSRDPWQTFDNDYFRPRGAVFKQPNFTVIPLGGARLRGFSPLLALDRVVSANLEASQQLATWSGEFGQLALWGGPFADAGAASASSASPAGLADHFLVDAGVGISIRGKFYDRDIKLRLDAPLVVNRPVTPASLGGLPSAIRWTVEW
jgi:hypothetical protein